MIKTVAVDKIKFGAKGPFVLISGPCVIENRAMVLSMAKRLKEITSRVGIPFVFKASYDKANRTSYKSFRGPGLEKGLDILQEVKERVGVPVTSDIHAVEEVALAAKVLDILQIPAFLCRQTDLLTEAGKSKKVVNVKKGQFLAPWDMAPAIRKIEKTGNKRILVTERGTSFGYNTLVTDFRSVPIMQNLGYPVVMDVSHSVQQPGGLGEATGGKSEYIPLLARCAVAAGCNAIFMETHPDPKKALSDGPNMLPLGKMEKVLKELKAIKKALK